MPCFSDYLEPTGRERESARILELLRETRGHAFNHARPIDGIYGNPATLDVDTRALCDWCKTHDVTAMSLELQIWWRDHQAADVAREAADTAKAERAALRASALAKLTPAERAALKGRE